MKNLLRSKKFWTFVSAIVAAFAAFFLSACGSTHRVIQSSSSFRRGDTIVTSITYEQIGKIQKNIK